MTTSPQTPTPRNVVAFALLKGGVGKSSTTAAMADAFARLGFSCLAVDMDSQANLTEHFGQAVSLIPGPPDRFGKSNDLVPDKATIVDVITNGGPGIATQAYVDVDWGYDADASFDRGGPLVPGKVGRLGIIPSYAGLEALASTWKPADLTRLDIALHGRDADGFSPTEDWDIILIDTPPAPGLLAIQAYRAADHVVVVTQAGAYAVAGTEKTLDFIGSLRADWGHPGLNFTGIILNEYTTQLLDHQYNAEQLRELLNEVVDGGADAVLWPEPVPQRTVVGAAQTAQAPVSAFLSDSSKRAAALSVTSVAEAHALRLAKALNLPGVDEIKALWLEAIANNPGAPTLVTASTNEGSSDV